MFNHDIDGVFRIEFLPRMHTASVCDRLASSIQRAEHVCAAVAYWTIDSDFIDPLLGTKLSNDDSFLCVDIHLPTSIDQLDTLVQNGANVYLHLRELDGRTETCKAPSMPPYLLHTKMLLFDMPDNTAEFWVGSHNWTRRALAGPNIEASLVLHLKQHSLLHKEAEQTLKYIRSLCTPFKHDDVDYYKTLQSQNTNQSVRLIELEGNHTSNLTGSYITIFGTNSTDLKEIKSLGQEVYTSIIDSESGQAFIYFTTIKQIGEGPRSLGFPACRHAFRKGRRLPVLTSSSVPDKKEVAQALYFVTLAVQKALPRNTQVLEPLPQSEKWRVTFDDPLMYRMFEYDALYGQLSTTTYREHLNEMLEAYREKICIKIPAPPGEIVPWQETLEQKRFLPDHKLVSRKLLRMKEDEE